MICPECGEEAQSGKLWGMFCFYRSIETPLLPRTIKHRSLYVALEAGAYHCEQKLCDWFGIDYTTLMQLRMKGGVRQSISASPVHNEKCPNCGKLLADGFVRGEFHFQADKPPPRSWHQFFAISPMTFAKAPAQFCSGCGWMGIDGSRFVQPG
ncbi:MAG: hypothetical protein V4671_27980 [Armatimonadota bacterium]